MENPSTRGLYYELDKLAVRIIILSSCNIIHSRVCLVSAANNVIYGAVGTHLSFRIVFPSTCPSSIFPSIVRLCRRSSHNKPTVSAGARVQTSKTTTTSTYVTGGWKTINDRGSAKKYTSPPLVIIEHTRARPGRGVIDLPPALKYHFSHRRCNNIT